LTYDVTLDYVIRGAFQQTGYHQQSFASADELKRAIINAWQKFIGGGRIFGG